MPRFTFSDAASITNPTPADRYGEYLARMARYGLEPLSLAGFTYELMSATERAALHFGPEIAAALSTGAPSSVRFGDGWFVRGRTQPEWLADADDQLGDA